MGTFPRKFGGGALGAAASTSFSLTTASLLGAACSLGTTGGFSIGDGVDCKLSLDVFECAIFGKAMGRTKDEEGMDENEPCEKKYGDGGCDQVMYRDSS